LEKIKAEHEAKEKLLKAKMEKEARETREDKEKLEAKLKKE
jgi:hypothetical protein